MDEAERVWRLLRGDEFIVVGQLAAVQRLNEPGLHGARTARGQLQLVAGARTAAMRALEGKRKPAAWCP